jgi:hypothetical protein
MKVQISVDPKVHFGSLRAAHFVEDWERAFLSEFGSCHALDGLTLYRFHRGTSWIVEWEFRTRTRLINHPVRFQSLSHLSL